MSHDDGRVLVLFVEPGWFEDVGGDVRVHIPGRISDPLDLDAFLVSIADHHWLSCRAGTLGLCRPLARGQQSAAYNRSSGNCNQRRADKLAPPISKNFLPHFFAPNFCCPHSLVRQFFSKTSLATPMAVTALGQPA